MQKGKYLSEAISLDTIKHGVLNLVEAPVGSGKTHFALNHLLGLTTNANRAVYLIDTLAGKEQILQQYPHVQIYSSSWRKNVSDGMISFEEDRYTIMTYAQFGTLVMYYPSFLSQLELIVCDELHNIFWPIGADKGRLAKEFPELSAEQLEALVKEKSANLAALSTLEALSQEGRCYVVAITATPNRVLKGFDGPINHMTSPVPLRQYETKEQRTYRNLEAELSKLESGNQYIVYVPHIAAMKQYVALSRAYGLRASAIWSTKNAKHPMAQEQLDLREHILTQQTFPPDLDILFINKSCETSINIRGNVAAIFVHTGEHDSIIQVRGRYRGDLPVLYVYSQDEQQIQLPPEYLNVPLYKEDKDRLIEELNIRDKKGTLKKWPTIRKRLEEQGHQIEDYHPSNRRYSIIRPSSSENPPHGGI